MNYLHCQLFINVISLITGRSSEIIGITFDDLPIDYPFTTPYELSSLPIVYKCHKSNANNYAFYMTNYEIPHFEGSPVDLIAWLYTTSMSLFNRYFSYYTDIGPANFLEVMITDPTKVGIDVCNEVEIEPSTIRYADSIRVNFRRVRNVDDSSIDSYGLVYPGHRDLFKIATRGLFLHDDNSYNCINDYLISRMIIFFPSISPNVAFPPINRSFMIPFNPPVPMHLLEYLNRNPVMFTPVCSAIIKIINQKFVYTPINLSLIVSALGIRSTQKSTLNEYLIASSTSDIQYFTSAVILTFFYPGL